MEFDSQFWSGEGLPVLAYELLRRFNDGSLPTNERADALKEMLVHETTPVRGVALDNFSLHNAQRRHGARPLADALEPAVRDCAMRELASAPYERTAPNAKP